jgi:hypothetical protein
MVAGLLVEIVFRVLTPALLTYAIILMTLQRYEFLHPQAQ